MNPSALCRECASWYRIKFDTISAPFEELTISPEIPQRTPQEIQRIAIPLIYRLSECAEQGDNDAVAALLEIAHFACVSLNLLPIDSKKALARNRTSWPINANVYKKLCSDMRLLEIGKALPEIREKKMNRIAAEMLLWLAVHDEALALPSLARETQDLWFAVGWEALLRETERNQVLANELIALAQSAVCKPKFVKNFEKAEATKSAQIRARLKTNFLTAFRQSLRLCGFTK